MKKFAFYEFNFDYENAKEIPYHLYDNNFTFIVDNKQYETNRVVADLLSPKIRKSHQTDPLMNSFIINTNNLFNNFDFNKILSLVNFETISLEIEEAKYFQFIFSILGNEKVFEKLITKYSTKLEKSNVIERILNKQKYFEIFNQTNSFQFNFEEFLKEEIDFISKHFDEIEQKSIENLNEEILLLILSNENLQIKSEDFLMNFILDFYEKTKNSSLFEFIIFENVNEESPQRFFNIFEIDDLNLKIWTQLFKRILKSTESKSNSKTNKNTEQNNFLEFPLKNPTKLNGIFRYLHNEAGGNPHDKGIIEITSSSIYSSDYHPKFSVDLDENNCFQTKNESNSWICFDFKDMKVELSNYSIKSLSNGPNQNHHLRNWKIETSNDQKEWTEIDNHQDDQTLNNDRAIGTFNTKQNGFSRFIRLRQTGPNWYQNPNGNCHKILFYYIEFYGKLQLPK